LTRLRGRSPFGVAKARASIYFTGRPLLKMMDGRVEPGHDEVERIEAMAIIRIEPKLDASSGLYYVEIFHPAEAEQPFVTTEPRYRTAAAAENDVIAIIASRANSSGS